MVWSVFGGPILGDQSEREAFPCSVALVLSVSEAFPCSVALVLRLSDCMKRYENNGFGARHLFRWSSGAAKHCGTKVFAILVKLGKLYLSSSSQVFSVAHITCLWRGDFRYTTILFKGILHSCYTPRSEIGLLHLEYLNFFS